MHSASGRGLKIVALVRVRAVSVWLPGEEACWTDSEGAFSPLYLLVLRFDEQGHSPRWVSVPVADAKAVAIRGGG